MNERNALIEKHYDLPGLFEDIIKRLKQQGVDLNNISRSDIAGVDEFHLRGAEVSKELVTLFDFKDLKVLDVGCGLGGPCRMLADEFNCNVSGIDMSGEFIRTAKKLSEINRVLNDNGTLIYYDIFKRDKGDVTYPVPWAGNVSVSYLGTIENMDTILNDLGFTRTQVTDHTNKSMEFLGNLFDKIKTNGPPKIGLNVLMGTSTIEKLGNVQKALEENKIELQSGIYKKGI